MRESKERGGWLVGGAGEGAKEGMGARTERKGKQITRGVHEEKTVVGITDGASRTALLKLGVLATLAPVPLFVRFVRSVFFCFYFLFLFFF